MPRVDEKARKIARRRWVPCQEHSGKRFILSMEVVDAEKRLFRCKADSPCVVPKCPNCGKIINPKKVLCKACGTINPHMKLKVQPRRVVFKNIPADLMGNPLLEHLAKFGPVKRFNRTGKSSAVVMFNASEDAIKAAQAHQKVTDGEMVAVVMPSKKPPKVTETKKIVKKPKSAKPRAKHMPKLTKEEIQKIRDKRRQYRQRVAERKAQRMAAEKGAVSAMQVDGSTPAAKGPTAESRRKANEAKKVAKANKEKEVKDPKVVEPKATDTVRGQTSGKAGSAAKRRRSKAKQSSKKATA